MKAITAYTSEEYEQMRDKCHKLNEAVKPYDRRELITIQRRSGYAHYQFKGTYTDALVAALGRQPTEDEIIMLVDGGFSHFGATCSIDKVHRTFTGRVNID